MAYVHLVNVPSLHWLITQLRPVQTTKQNIMIRSQSFPVAIFLNRKMDSRLIRHHEQELSITHKRKGAFQTADPSRYEKSSTTKGPSERKKERQEMRSLFFFFFFQHKNNSYSFPSWLLPPYNLRARGRRWRAKQKATTRRRKQHSTFFLSWRANISFLFFSLCSILCICCCLEILRLVLLFFYSSPRSFSII